MNARLPVGPAVVHRLDTDSLMARRTACGRGWASARKRNGDWFAVPTDDAVTCPACLDAIRDAGKAVAS